MSNRVGALHHFHDGARAPIARQIDARLVGVLCVVELKVGVEEGVVGDKRIEENALNSKQR